MNNLKWQNNFDAISCPTRAGYPSDGEYGTTLGIKILATNPVNVIFMYISRL